MTERNRWILLLGFGGVAIAIVWFAIAAQKNSNAQALAEARASRIEHLKLQPQDRMIPIDKVFADMKTGIELAGKGRVERDGMSIWITTSVENCNIAKHSYELITPNDGEIECIGDGRSVWILDRKQR